MGRSPKVLEIGVSHGGSLQLWKEYFGPGARITGFDIDPRCRDFVEPQIEVYTVDQSDSRELARLSQILGPFDIVIDDGSHVLEHQEGSFTTLWPNTEGVYLIEDCHQGYPVLIPSVGYFCDRYPWVLVMERPKRVIRGTPSRELREDEREAIRMYPDL